MDDYMVRAIAADGTIRAFAAYTRNTVEKARSLHNTSLAVNVFQTQYFYLFLQPVR